MGVIAYSMKKRYKSGYEATGLIGLIHHTGKYLLMHCKRAACTDRLLLFLLAFLSRKENKPNHISNSDGLGTRSDRDQNSCDRPYFIQWSTCATVPCTVISLRSSMVVDIPTIPWRRHTRELAELNLSLAVSIGLGLGTSLGCLVPRLLKCLGTSRICGYIAHRRARYAILRS